MEQYEKYVSSRPSCYINQHNRGACTWLAMVFVQAQYPCGEVGIGEGSSVKLCLVPCLGETGRLTVHMRTTGLQWYQVSGSRAGASSACSPACLSFVFPVAQDPRWPARRLRRSLPRMSC